MASGYTHGVATGDVTSLRAFTMRCARAFVGFMRDWPADAPIPTTYPEWNTYDADVSNAIQLLDRVKSATDEWFESDIDRKHRDRVEAEDRYHKNSTVTRARYEAMIAKVTAWDAPEVLRPTREFMLDQLNESIRFDCPAPRAVTVIDRPTVAEFRAAEIAEAERVLAAARERAAKETARVKAMNKWLAEFHAALPND